MLKNPSEVALVPKNIFFLKILNLAQSFAKCKVSLAGGSLHLQHFPIMFLRTVLKREESFQTVFKIVFSYD
jgi:hypothetical protein